MNHLFYMDEIKLYAATKLHLQYVIETISQYMQVQFRINKCINLYRKR